MSIIEIDKDIEFEKDLLNLLVEHGYIPEDRKDRIKRVELGVFADGPMQIEVIEEGERL